MKEIVLSFFEDRHLVVVFSFRARSSRCPSLAAISQVTSHLSYMASHKEPYRSFSTLGGLPLPDNSMLQGSP